MNQCCADLIRDKDGSWDDTVNECEQQKLKAFYQLLRPPGPKKFTNPVSKIPDNRCFCEVKRDEAKKQTAVRKQRELLLLQCMCASLQPLKEKLKQCKEKKQSIDLKDQIIKQCLHAAIELILKSRKKAALERKRNACRAQIMDRNMQAVQGSVQKSRMDELKECCRHYALTAARQYHRKMMRPSENKIPQQRRKLAPSSTGSVSFRGSRHELCDDRKYVRRGSDSDVDPCVASCLKKKKKARKFKHGSFSKSPSDSYKMTTSPRQSRHESRRKSASEIDLCATNYLNEKKEAKKSRRGCFSKSPSDKTSPRQSRSRNKKFTPSSNQNSPYPSTTRLVNSINSSLKICDNILKSCDSLSSLHSNRSSTSYEPYSSHTRSKDRSKKFKRKRVERKRSSSKSRESSADVTCKKSQTKKSSRRSFCGRRSGSKTSSNSFKMDPKRKECAKLFCKETYEKPKQCSRNSSSENSLDKCNKKTQKRKSRLSGCFGGKSNSDTSVAAKSQCQGKPCPSKKCMIKKSMVSTCSSANHDSKQMCSTSSIPPDCRSRSRDKSPRRCSKKKQPNCSRETSPAPETREKSPGCCSRKQQPCSSRENSPVVVCCVQSDTKCVPPANRSRSKEDNPGCCSRKRQPCSLRENSPPPKFVPPARRSRSKEQSPGCCSRKSQPCSSKENSPAPKQQSNTKCIPPACRSRSKEKNPGCCSRKSQPCSSTENSPAPKLQKCDSKKRDKSLDFCKCNSKSNIKKSIPQQNKLPNKSSAIIRTSSPDLKLQKCASNCLEKCCKEAEKSRSQGSSKKNLLAPCKHRSSDCKLEEKKWKKGCESKRKAKRETSCDSLKSKNPNSLNRGTPRSLRRNSLEDCCDALKQLRGGCDNPSNSSEKKPKRSVSTDTVNLTRFRGRWFFRGKNTLVPQNFLPPRSSLKSPMQSKGFDERKRLRFHSKSDDCPESSSRHRNFIPSSDLSTDEKSHQKSTTDLSKSPPSKDHKSTSRFSKLSSSCVWLKEVKNQLKRNRQKGGETTDTDQKCRKYEKNKSFISKMNEYCRTCHSSRNQGSYLSSSSECDSLKIQGPTMKEYEEVSGKTSKKSFDSEKFLNQSNYQPRVTRASGLHDLNCDTNDYNKAPSSKSFHDVRKADVDENPCPSLLSDLSLTKVYKDLLVILRPDLLSDCETKRPSKAQQCKKKRRVSIRKKPVICEDKEDQDQKICETLEKIVLCVLPPPNQSFRKERRHRQRSRRRTPQLRYNTECKKPQASNFINQKGIQAAEVANSICEKFSNQKPYKSKFSKYITKPKSGCCCGERKVRVNYIDPERWACLKKRLRAPKNPQPLPEDFVLDTRTQEYADAETERCRKEKRQRQLEEWQNDLKRKQRESDPFYCPQMQDQTAEEQPGTEVYYVCKPVKTKSSNGGPCIFECCYCPNQKTACERKKEDNSKFIIKCDENMSMSTNVAQSTSECANAPDSMFLIQGDDPMMCECASERQGRSPQRESVKQYERNSRSRERARCPKRYKNSSSESSKVRSSSSAKKGEKTYLSHKKSCCKKKTTDTPKRNRDILQSTKTTKERSNSFSDRRGRSSSSIRETRDSLTSQRNSLERSRKAKLESLYRKELESSKRVSPNNYSQNDKALATSTSSYYSKGNSDSSEKSRRKASFILENDLQSSSCCSSVLDERIRTEPSTSPPKTKKNQEDCLTNKDDKTKRSQQKCDCEACRSGTKKIDADRQKMQQLNQNNMRNQHKLEPTRLECTCSLCNNGCCPFNMIEQHFSCSRQKESTNAQEFNQEFCSETSTSVTHDKQLGQRHSWSCARDFFMMCKNIGGDAENDCELNTPPCVACSEPNTSNPTNNQNCLYLWVPKPSQVDSTERDKRDVNLCTSDGSLIQVVQVQSDELEFLIKPPDRQCGGFIQTEKSGRVESVKPKKKRKKRTAGSISMEKQVFCYKVKCEQEELNAKKPAEMATQELIVTACQFQKKNSTKPDEVKIKICKSMRPTENNNPSKNAAKTPSNQRKCNSKR